jgi:hypothetical protein
MLSGLGGSLLSHYFAERVLPQEFAGRLGEASRRDAHRRFAQWWDRSASQLGPASSVRAIWDVAASGLMEQLGLNATSCSVEGTDTRHALVIAGDTRIAVIAATWDVSLDRLWRRAVRLGIGSDASWVLCTNGRDARLVDARRTYSRAYLQFDLQRTAQHPATFEVFWSVLREDALRSRAGEAPLVHQIVQSSVRHGESVSRSLRFGVLDAVEHLLGGFDKCRGRHDLSELFDESLTVVYRVLFLMFAESRRLVPNWHPLYRESYTIESLRDRAERPGPARGFWETLQAIARLAHQGCRAGSLVVPAFNGRLFSPARSPIAEACAVADETARSAVLALSTTHNNDRRTRIDYRDLGVEQLGAVYESILDYSPARAGTGAARVHLRHGGGTRKSTGSFYTPQAITEYLVRRALHPLVAEATSDSILRLRVLDPAMGSAAFLVSACRYLARAYERALVREGTVHEAEIGDADRAEFRRLVAQRCLFGVDLNPTAVQLARLSLWLATMAADKPLTFLDHHLVCGNSLVGASPADIARQPPSAGRTRAPGTASTPLFSDADFESSLALAVVERQWLAETGDDTAAVVREKEKRLDRLRASQREKSIADLWCACWMWPDRDSVPGATLFASLADELARGRRQLSDRVAAPLFDVAERVVRTHRFFHWLLEFPEVFFDERGHPLPDGGFDAVLGNPPWDMLRAGSVEKTFVRRAGVYRHQGPGRINRYQLFVERALTLAKRGGRIGLLLPAGFATDHTSAPLRRRLLSATRIDTITGFDNRKAIFPIHRSVRFLTCTATAGERTHRIACRFGIDDPVELDSIPDSGDAPRRASHPIALTPSFIEAFGGNAFVIPELRSDVDVRILERIVHDVPRLDSASGWNVRFGRELNATDDRRHFHGGRTGLPVLEGKHIEPFRAHLDRSTRRISAASASRLLDAAATFARPRLAYRDVASPTNRLSLIAAVLPAGVVTTHSLFCLKTAMSGDSQAFLCAMLNSYVANYLVRQIMTTHLGSATIEGLRVPKLPFDSPLFEQIVSLSHSLRQGPSHSNHAHLQALAAQCYGLSARELAHVLSTFPLVEQTGREMVMEAFTSS